jgi:ribosomal protein S18 acetylase RimI-like enzyme
MKVTIQLLKFLPFTIADYDEVVAFWKSQKGVGLNETDERDRIAGYLERNPGMSVIVRDGKQLIGAVLCGHDGRRGYLNHLAVAASHRHRGVGREIVRLCLERLRQADVQRCNVFLFTENAEGEIFWRALGFKNRSDLKVMQRSTGD